MIQNLLKKFKNDQDGAAWPIYILFFTMGMMIFVMFYSQWETVVNQRNEVHDTISNAAELRAQRINNPLKESEGLIEAMPTPNQIHRDYVNPLSDLPLGYEYEDYSVTSPNNRDYIEQLDQEVFNFIKDDLETNSDSLIKLREGDLCVQTVPLPTGMGEKITVKCTVRGVDRYMEQYINGTDHPATQAGDLQVVNAVFIGGFFEMGLIHKGMMDLIGPAENINTETKSGGKFIWTVAYPHVEQSTRAW